MNIYEDQLADVLLRDLFDLGKKTAWTVDDEIEYDEDVAAIKYAVIREATLTIAVVKTREYEDEVTAPKGSPNRIVTLSQNVGLQGFVPDGEYYLIKKETL